MQKDDESSDMTPPKKLMKKDGDADVGDAKANATDTL
jgi:hypothetical protein